MSHHSSPSSFNNTSYNDKPILTLVNSNKLKSVNYKVKINFSSQINLKIRKIKNKINQTKEHGYGNFSIKSTTSPATANTSMTSVPNHQISLVQFSSPGQQPLPTSATTFLPLLQPSTPPHTPSALHAIQTVSKFNNNNNHHSHSHSSSHQNHNTAKPSIVRQTVITSPSKTPSTTASHSSQNQKPSNLDANNNPIHYVYKKTPNQTILVLSKPSTAKSAQQQQPSLGNSSSLISSQQKISNKPNNLISSYFNNQICKEIKTTATNGQLQQSNTNPIPINMFENSPVVTATNSSSANSQIIKSSATATIPQPITLIPIGKLTDKFNGFTADNLNFLQQINLNNSHHHQHHNQQSMLAAHLQHQLNQHQHQQSEINMEPCIETIEISTATVEIEIDSSEQSTTATTTLDKINNRVKNEKRHNSKQQHENENNSRDYENISNTSLKTKKEKKDKFSKSKSGGEFEDNSFGRSSKKSKSSNKNSTEIISCICRMEHDDGYMICCDNCQ